MWWFRRYDAFISYSHKDATVVKPLIDLLSVNQQRVFWDGDLKPGDDWDAVIQKALKRSGIFVLFWCCDTSQSAEVSKEIAAAIRHKKRIVPVKLCPAALPADLNRWQWVDLQSHVQHRCLSLDHGNPTASAGEFSRLFEMPTGSFHRAPPAPLGPSEYTRILSGPAPLPRPITPPTPVPAARASGALRIVMPVVAAASVVVVIATISFSTFGKRGTKTETAGVSKAPPVVVTPHPPPTEQAASHTYVYVAAALALAVLATLLIRHFRRARSGKALDLTMSYLENLGR